ncbi:hypothetical protein ACJMK2_044767 [Sinanodonta woodiana]|uniref:SGNH hydrolase-type esterase domain-containing protein n=1 Tax=Sinanodonta woodiana TaxID=1069815 RepID=A0ABD3T2W8_SINWO
MLPQLLLIGHSLIANLKIFCSLARNKCRRDIQGLKTDFLGLRGATTSTILKIIKRPFRRTIKHVILQVGGNDLRSEKCIDVANNITQICTELIQKGIEKVLVVSILPRDNPRDMTKRQYCLKRKRLNRILAARYMDHKQIIFCKCVKFRPSYFAKDKSHLNKMGNKWLYIAYSYFVKKHVLKNLKNPV